MDFQQMLVPGTTVYDVNGEKIGSVVTVEQNYVIVEKGFFFPKDHYIPLDAIAEYDDNGLYLSLTKDEVLNQNWDEAPDATLGAREQVTMSQGADMLETHATYAGDETVRVPVHEEHLAASKRMAQAGEVTIDKRVVTEQETIEVPVMEERVRVQWTAPTGEVTDEGEVFEEGTIEVPVSREVVDVSKRTVQTGELEVTKEREQRTQKVTDSVRREVVDVDDTTVDDTPGRPRS